MQYGNTSSCACAQAPVLPPLRHQHFSAYTHNNIIALIYEHKGFMKQMQD